YGQKRARAHMEGDEVARQLPRVKRLHQPVGEMKSRSRRGDRPLLPGEHGLIVVSVALVGWTARGDVRRERHGALRLDGFVECDAGKIEGECHLSFLAPRLDRRGKTPEQAGIATLTEDDAIAGLEPFRRTRERLPTMIVEP